MLVGRFGGTSRLSLPFFLLASFPIYLSRSFLRQQFILSPTLHSENIFYLFLLDTFVLLRHFPGWISLDCCWSQPPIGSLSGAGHSSLSVYFYPDFCCMTYFSTLKMGAASFSEKTVNMYHFIRCHIVSFLQAAADKICGMLICPSAVYKLKNETHSLHFCDLKCFLCNCAMWPLAVNEKYRVVILFDDYPLSLPAAHPPCVRAVG